MASNRSNQILLLEKGKRGMFRVVFGRTGVVLILLTAQVAILYSIFKFLGTLIPFTVGTLLGFSVLMSLYIINSNHNTSVKLTWILMIMLLPGFGGFFYIFIKRDLGYRSIKKRLKHIFNEFRSEFIDSNDLMNQLRDENKPLYNLSTYIRKSGGFPIYANESSKYFPIGEEAFEEMIKEIKKAKKFIFMEYFIVDEGYMWGQILKLLSDKVKEGVEVRFMYDGTCEFALLPYNYSEKLKKLGIMCKVFAPIRPLVSTHYNYRDHRKIMVVDGEVAFTGGINLSDEYINEREVYGHWKDSAIMIRGKAVESFTLMFLQMWNVDESDKFYMKDIYKSTSSNCDFNGYVIPFGDSPFDSYRVGQMVYIDILNRARDYVYIMTPYLILDGETVTALQFAAKKGIDVRIIMPHIPDKKLVFAQSRSYYKELIKAGVKIYEYTPGFMHAKVFLSDDIRSVVGTINLDYRSLYHHFECGLYMEESDTLKDIKRDFTETLNQSQMVTLEDIKNYNVFMTLAGKIFKPFAPLM